MEPIIISCVNLKGGVGKTAIATNFASYCGQIGKKTLLIDLDPQTNATFSCIDVDEWESHAETNGTVANLFGLRSHTNAEGTIKDAKDVLYKNVFPNVDLIPSHLDLFTIDLELAGITARERKLQKALRPIINDYDIIVCDCPPNLTIPTQNALALSTHYIVPISPDYLSGIGVGLLINRIKELVEDLDHNILLAGIIISRVGRPARFREETVGAIRQTFGRRVLSSEIHERVAVSQATAQHKPIFDMPDSVAASEFKNMSKEVLKILGI